MENNYLNSREEEKKPSPMSEKADPRVATTAPSAPVREVKAEPKKKSSFDLLKLVSYIGIGALIVSGLVALVGALLPAGGLNYAVLGVVCLTSAITLSLLLGLNAKSSCTAPIAPASNGELEKALAKIALLEAKLERERAVLGSLFELEEYTDKNEAFRAERIAQYEAKMAIDSIKSILMKISEINDEAVRFQYMREIERVIAQYDINISGDDE